MRRSGNGIRDGGLRHKLQSFLLPISRRIAQAILQKF